MPSFSKLLRWILEARVPGETINPPRRGGELLPYSGGPEGRCGNGSQRACTQVRTVVERTAVGVVDRRCRRDPQQASTQAEDGSAGCTTDFAVAAGRALSPNLGAELGESRSTATALAPAPHGAVPHADHEPTASRSSQ